MNRHRVNTQDACTCKTHEICNRVTHTFTLALKQEDPLVRLEFETAEQ